MICCQNAYTVEGCQITAVFPSAGYNTYNGYHEGYLFICISYSYGCTDILQYFCSFKT